MSALVHQLRAELRAYRVYFLIWFVLLALHLVCVLSGEYWAYHPLKHHPLVAIFRLTGFWVMLAALLLTKAAAFNDPPLDPDAFWRTKPISGGTLMAAKVVALGVMFVLPALLVDGWLAVRMGGGGAVAAVALDHLLVRWGAMVAVLALAALAGSPMRLMGLALGLLLAVGGVTGVLSHVSAPDQFDYTPTLIASRFLVAGACAWVGASTVLYLLYACRRSGRARGVAGFTAALLGATFLAWPIDFYRHAPSPADELRLASVSLAIRGATSTPASYGPAGARLLVLQATLTHPPGPFVARLHTARMKLASPAGGGGWGGVAPDYRGQTLETADQVALLGLPDSPLETPHDISLRLPGGPWEGHSARVTVAAAIDLYEHVPVGELVLEAGSVLRLPYGEIEVLGLAWAPNMLVVDVRERVLQPIFALHGPVAVLPRSAPGALWTFVLPSTAEGRPPQLAHSKAGPYAPPGQSEQTLFSMFRYSRHQLEILRLDHEPNSVELIESYRGRTVQIYQRLYRGTVRRMAERDKVDLSAWEGGH